MSKKKRIARVKKNRRQNSQYQPLEPRNLLAGITLTGGELILGGSTGADVATVSISGSTVTAALSGVDTETYPASSITSIRFVGLAGNDRFTNNTSIPSFAFGQAGDDILIGGSGNDLLAGGPGIDRMEGNAGDDIVRGGIDGKKTIRGGTGNDRLFGGTGDNDIDAGDGDDVVHGGAGVDEIRGGDGDDELYPGGGDDIVHGGAGNDSVNSGTGIDMIFGEAGEDLIFSGPGNDVVEGGDDDDFINGGDGDDLLRGGNDNDRLTGANGDDTIEGGAGVDVLNGGFGDDTIDGGSNPTGSGDRYRVDSIEANYRVSGTLQVRDMFGDGGTDSLDDINWLQFNDDNYAAESQVEEVITVQPIIVANSNGSNRADFFGNATSEWEIKEFADDILYKGGGKTTFNWLPARNWNNTSANNGTFDVNDLVENVPSNLIGDPQTTVNLFIIERVKGISSTSEDSAFGVSLLGASGSSLRVGRNLLAFEDGREAIARVAVHEIAHNLGLEHASGSANLMFGGGISGDNLTSSQRSVIRASQFSADV